MRLEEMASAILFGTRWEDKLATLTDPRPAASGPALAAAPRFPGRPAALARIGKAEFPKLSRLREDSTRGRVLHFFANHELLAMELMALVLLRFPDAPEAFRAGLARTIAEEQSHLRLYVERMRELGVDFGELPVSDYFWNAMKDVATPLQFVTQMSLTLEAANLDFSLFYRDAVAAVGDERTASVLDRVYREEIGHVKHGLTWFNRWRPSGERDWDAYRRLLPPPMTPRRAKGELAFGKDSTPLYAADARREAGFSEEFVRELEVHSGSKGRPPVFWSYNPLCDAEIARGRPGHTAPAPVRRLGADLEAVIGFLARDTDVVLVDELPRAEWLKSLRDAGFAPPEFRRRDAGAAAFPERRIGGLEPWGWSPEPFARFRPLRGRLGCASASPSGTRGDWCRELLERNEDFPATGLGRFFSKAWSCDFLERWMATRAGDAAVAAAFGEPDDSGRALPDLAAVRAATQAALAAGRTLLAKAPYATSGMGNRRILSAEELDGPIGGWVRNVLATQGTIVVEPWLDKIADLSIQLDIGDENVRPLGIRRFVNGPQLEYRGTLLDSRLTSLPEEARRFLHGAISGEAPPPAPLDRWRQLVREVGAELRAGGYRGPAGIDAMLWRHPSDGRLRLKPLVELNPRWTMGRVALELESRVQPGLPAAWLFLPVRELPQRKLPAIATAAAGELARRHPLRLDGNRIAGGTLFTNDPACAREVLTVLIVGEAALADPALAWNAPGT